MNTTNMEKNPRSITRRTRPAFLALLIGLGVTSFAWLAARAEAGGEATLMRWDLIHLIKGVLSSGGFDSAKAADGSQITLTGSGTWVSDPDQGERPHQRAKGGGTWKTIDGKGASTGSGSYIVTGVADSEVFPGSNGSSALTDNIGSYLDARGGLLILQVLYSDGERGVLTVSCHGPGTHLPATVFEGITATKGIVGYADRGENEDPTVDANRTVFHVLHHAERASGRGTSLLDPGVVSEFRFDQGHVECKVDHAVMKDGTVMQMSMESTSVDLVAIDSAVKTVTITGSMVSIVNLLSPDGTKVTMSETVPYTAFAKDSDTPAGADVFSLTVTYDPKAPKPNQFGLFGSPATFTGPILTGHVEIE
jgi:hypothetical protein